MKDQDELERLLLKALKREPEGDLPFNFAAMVTRKVFIKPGKLQSSAIAIGYGVIISAVLCIALFPFKPELMVQLFSILNSGKYIIATAIAGFLMIQYLDQKFVKTL